MTRRSATTAETKECIYMCEYCDMSYGSVGELRAHKCDGRTKAENTTKAASNHKPTCDDCGQKFSTEDHLEQHRKHYHAKGEVEFQLVIATEKKAAMARRASPRVGLQEDINIVHVPYKTGKPQCRYCKQEFSTSGPVTIHERYCAFNPKKTEFMCQYCNRKYELESVYRAHLKQCEAGNCHPKDKSLKHKTPGSPALPITWHVCGYCHIKKVSEQLLAEHMMTCSMRPDTGGKNVILARQQKPGMVESVGESKTPTISAGAKAKKVRPIVDGAKPGTSSSTIGPPTSKKPKMADSDKPVMDVDIAATAIAAEEASKKFQSSTPGQKSKKVLLKCKQCDMLFDGHMDFINHMDMCKVNDLSALRECSCCGKEFDNYSIKLEHEAQCSETEGAMLTCYDCHLPIPFEADCKLKGFCACGTGQAFTCSYCTKKFTSMALLSNHIDHCADNIDILKSKMKAAQRARKAVVKAALAVKVDNAVMKHDKTIEIEDFTEEEQKDIEAREREVQRLRREYMQKSAAKKKFEICTYCGMGDFKNDKNLDAHMRFCKWIRDQKVVNKSTVEDERSRERWRIQRQPVVSPHVLVPQHAWQAQSVSSVFSGEKKNLDEASTVLTVTKMGSVKKAAKVKVETSTSTITESVKKKHGHVDVHETEQEMEITIPIEEVEQPKESPAESIEKGPAKNEYLCKYCHGMFGNRIYLNAHIMKCKQIHEDMKMKIEPEDEGAEDVKHISARGEVQCRTCSKYFQKATFAYHASRCNPHADSQVGGGFRCNTCGYIFSSLMKLTEHSFQCCEEPGLEGQVDGSRDRPTHMGRNGRSESESSDFSTPTKSPSAVRNDHNCVCSFCGCAFGNFGGLAMHEKLCGQLSPTKRQLEAEIVNPKASSYPCPHCSKRIGNKGALAVHVKQTHKVSTKQRSAMMYEEQANRQFEDERKMVKSEEMQELVQSNMELFCEYCMERFGNGGALGIHKEFCKVRKRIKELTKEDESSSEDEDESEEDNLTCMWCYTELGNKGAKTIHVRYCRSRPGFTRIEEPQLICQYCNSEFRNKGGLSTHVKFCKYKEKVMVPFVQEPKEEKTPSGKVLCMNCMEEFANITVVKEHARYCSQVSISNDISTKGNVGAGEGTSSGPVPSDTVVRQYFICPYCGSHYRNRKTLQYHLVACLTGVDYPRGEPDPAEVTERLARERMIELEAERLKNLRKLRKKPKKRDKDKEDATVENGATPPKDKVKPSIKKVPEDPIVKGGPRYAQKNRNPNKQVKFRASSQVEGKDKKKEKAKTEDKKTDVTTKKLMKMVCDRCGWECMGTKMSLWNHKRFCTKKAQNVPVKTTDKAKQISATRGKLKCDLCNRLDFNNHGSLTNHRVFCKWIRSMVPEKSHIRAINKQELSVHVVDIRAVPNSAAKTSKPRTKPTKVTSKGEMLTKSVAKHTVSSKSLKAKQVAKKAIKRKIETAKVVVGRKRARFRLTNPPKKAKPVVPYVKPTKPQQKSHKQPPNVQPKKKVLCKPVAKQNGQKQKVIATQVQATTKKTLNNTQIVPRKATTVSKSSDNVHLGPVRYECEFCSRESSNRGAMLQHMKYCVHRSGPTPITPHVKGVKVKVPT